MLALEVPLFTTLLIAVIMCGVVATMTRSRSGWLIGARVEEPIGQEHRPKRLFREQRPRRGKGKDARVSYGLFGRGGAT